MPTTPPQQQWRSEAIRAAVVGFEVVIGEEDRLVEEVEVNSSLRAQPFPAPKPTDWLVHAGRGGFQQQSFGPPAQVLGESEGVDATRSRLICIRNGNIHARLRRRNGVRIDQPKNSILQRPHISREQGAKTSHTLLYVF